MSQSLVWLLSEDGFDRAGVVQACGGEQDGYSARILFYENAPSDAGETGESRARIKWIEAAGRIVEHPVSLENAGGGEIEAALAEDVPTPSVVLLAGGEFQCLASTVSCEKQGEQWIARLHAISDAYPTPQPVAA
jgi:hypothetical protein